MIQRLRLVILCLVAACLAAGASAAVKPAEGTEDPRQAVRLRIYLPTSDQTIEVTSAVDGGLTTVEEKGAWKIGLTIARQAGGSGLAVNLVDLRTLGQGEETQSIAESSPLGVAAPLTFLRQGQPIEITLLKTLDLPLQVPGSGGERIPIERCCVTCGNTTACGCAVEMNCGSCCSGGCCG